MLNLKGRASAGAVFCLSIAACSVVKRETVDRLADEDPSPWTSPSDCEDTSASKTSTHPPRVGSWNIRYFPDTEEGTGSDPDTGTDVGWLSCAIASLHVDVLAVQEFKITPEAVEKQKELIELLNQRTGGDWKIETSSCEPKEVQHPGFLYDGARVTGSHFRELPALNPNPKCSNDSSPGFAGYFAVEGGPDFHMISVHFSSGDAAVSMSGRAEAIAAMPDVVSEAQALVADADVLFAGDFNTSGCTDCSKPVASTDEIASMADQLDAAEHPLRLIGANAACSREDGDKSFLMDHFVTTDTMQEVAEDAIAKISGICEGNGCDRLHAWHEDARQFLSDHCPLTLDLAATDDD